jgi:DUF1009 family protein
MLHRRDFAKAMILVAGTGALLIRSASAADEKEPQMAAVGLRRVADQRLSILN